MTVAHSIFIGAIASVISYAAVHLKTRSSLDDTLDVFPCHGVGGIVGMVMTGIFAKDVGLFYGETKTFVFHLGALLAISLFCLVSSYLLYLLADFLVPMRVSESEEDEGLDLSQHGESLAI